MEMLGFPLEGLLSSSSLPAQHRDTKNNFQSYHSSSPYEASSADLHTGLQHLRHRLHSAVTEWLSSQTLCLPSPKYWDNLNLPPQPSNLLQFSQLSNDGWKSTLQVQNAPNLIILIFPDSSYSIDPNVSCQQLLFNVLPCYQLSRKYFTTIIYRTISFRTVPYRSSFMEYF